MRLARFRGASAVSTKFVWLVGSCPNIRVHAVWLPASAAASAFEEQKGEARRRCRCSSLRSLSTQRSRSNDESPDITLSQRDASASVAYAHLPTSICPRRCSDETKKSDYRHRLWRSSNSYGHYDGNFGSHHVRFAEAPLIVLYKSPEQCCGNVTERLSTKWPDGPILVQLPIPF